jgi:hypothetical protein
MLFTNGERKNRGGDGKNRSGENVVTKKLPSVVKKNSAHEHSLRLNTATLVINI